MDMKRILQAMDGVAAKPVEGADSMAKFLRTVTESEINQLEAVGDPANLVDQISAYIRYSSGLYQKGMPSITIKPGLVLPITFTPVPATGDSSKIIQANVLAANARLPKELQLPPDQLSALVGGANQPYQGPKASDPYTGPVAEGLSKFLSIVKQNDVSILNEGANPHKVALPVQMAMQHYQQPKVEPVIVANKPSLLQQYFQETEDIVAEQIAEEQAIKQQRVRMYSQKIAERVLMKESRTDEIAGAFPSPSTREKWAKDAAISNAAEAKRQAALKAQADAERLKTNTELVDKEQKTNYHSLDGVAVPPKTNEAPIAATDDPNDPMIHSHAKANAMTLKGRIQQARNQLRDLANMAESNDLATWEKICQLSKGGMFMGLEQNIEQVRHGIDQLAAKRKQGGVASRGIDKYVGEDEDPCWKDYKQIGMKKKGGKSVPNCVPKE